MAGIKCGRKDQNAEDMFVALCDFPIISLFLPLPPQPAFHSCATTPVTCHFCEQNLTLPKNQVPGCLIPQVPRLPCCAMPLLCLLLFFRSFFLHQGTSLSLPHPSHCLWILPNVSLTQRIIIGVVTYIFCGHFCQLQYGNNSTHLINRCKA